MQRKERGVDIISCTFKGLFILVILFIGYAFYTSNQLYSEQTIVYEDMITKGYSTVDVYRFSVEKKNTALAYVSYSKMSESTILNELAIAYKSCEIDVVSNLISRLVRKCDYYKGFTMSSNGIAQFLLAENLLGKNYCPSSRLLIDADLKRVFYVFEVSVAAKEGRLSFDEFEEICGQPDKELKNRILLIARKNPDKAMYNAFLEIASKNRYRSHLRKN